MPTPSAFVHEEREPIPPENVTVQLNIKVPWHYREQLQRMAKEAGTSFNRFVINALVRSVPPERR